MDLDWVRNICLAFPGATEKVTWGHDLTFRVANKMFAVAVTEVAPVWLTFKASDENFAELTERSGIIPAPYLARAKWVALETKDALVSNELGELLRESYEMVAAKLPAKVRSNLSGPEKRSGAARKSQPGRKPRKPLGQKKRTKHWK
jgi:predicted DNA-binding protein (MmcQ/YjbR family)